MPSYNYAIFEFVKYYARKHLIYTKIVVLKINITSWNNFKTVL